MIIAIIIIIIMNSKHHLKSSVLNKYTMGKKK